MITAPVDLTPFLPITRVKAAEIAAAAGKYSAMLTLERDGIVLNLKSMIGLLSQSIPKDGLMTLIANGKDETDALNQILDCFALDPCIESRMIHDGESGCL